MHIFPTKLKMKSAFFLHKDSVSFVMLHLYTVSQNLTNKKSLRVAFLLFIMILFLSKRQSGNHVMFHTIISGQTVVLKLMQI